MIGRGRGRGRGGVGRGVRIPDAQVPAAHERIEEEAEETPEAPAPSSRAQVDARTTGILEKKRPTWDDSDDDEPPVSGMQNLNTNGKISNWILSRINDDQYL